MVKAMLERAIATPARDIVPYTDEQQAIIEKFRADMAAVGGLVPSWWAHATADQIADAAIAAVPLGHGAGREAVKASHEAGAAEERERWRTLLRTPHRMAGACPDEIAGHDSRDLDCPACRLMVELGA
jgi:hypothetical protein